MNPVSPIPAYIADRKAFFRPVPTIQSTKKRIIGTKIAGPNVMNIWFSACKKPAFAIFYLLLILFIPSFPTRKESFN